MDEGDRNPRSRKYRVYRFLVQRKVWFIAMFITMLPLVFFIVKHEAGLNVRDVLIQRGLDVSIVDEKLRKKANGTIGSHLDYPNRIDASLSHISRKESGITVSAGGAMVFYPFSILARYEVVNDDIAGQPILVAYCTTCQTGIIADRVIDGVAIDFEATEYLWEGALVIASNDEDGGLWASASGHELKSGDQVSRQLSFLSFDIVTFETFVRQNPNGKVIEL